jgi:lysophospholipase L1-like esterase
MLKFLIASAVCGAMLSGAAFSQSPLPDSLKGVHRIVMLGDSITQFGEGAKGYVWLVRHYLQAMYPSQDLQVINAGVSGNRSNDMLARYEKDVLGPKPDLITISVGVNDVWHGFNDQHPDGDGPNGIPLEDYKKNVESMVTQGMTAGAKVVILSATPIGEDLDNKLNAKAKAYNDALKDIARHHHLLYVDYQKPFRTLITDYRRQTGGTDLLLTVDGVHMNDGGNEVMAHTLLTALGISADTQKAANKRVYEQAQGQ